MTLSIIAAIGPNNVIGNEGKLPWHLPEDLKRFKSLTMGHPIIMGRKTYESIGKPLPGRKNIVVTRQEKYEAPGCFVAHSLDDAIESCWDEDVFVIGGAEIYKQALPIADKLYLTEVRLETPGEIRFPEFDKNDWQEMTREKHENYDFSVYKNKRR